MQNDKATRKCKKCEKIKNLTEFPFYDKHNVGRRHECILCNKIRVNAHHNDNREWRLECARKRYAKDPSSVWTPERRARANELARKRAAQLRDRVYKLFGNKCVCCGETEPMFLTLDHIHNDGQHMRKKIHGNSSARIYLQILRGKLKNIFQLLCMNCNFGKSRNNGKCPHKSKEGSTTIPKGSRIK